MLPGDQLVALKKMKAWVSIDMRGTDGAIIAAGTMVLVIGSWTVDDHRRLVVVRDGQVCIFSCRIENVALNWAKTTHELLKDWDGLVLELGFRGALRAVEGFQARSQGRTNDSSEPNSGPNSPEPLKT